MTARDLSWQNIYENKTTLNNSEQWNRAPLIRNKVWQFYKFVLFTTLTHCNLRAASSIQNVIRKFIGGWWINWIGGGGCGGWFDSGGFVARREPNPGQYRDLDAEVVKLKRTEVAIRMVSITHNHIVIRQNQNLFSKKSSISSILQTYLVFDVFFFLQFRWFPKFVDFACLQDY